MPILHAPNVHQGGGRTLLYALLETAGGFFTTVILDHRFTPPALPDSVEVIFIPPTLAGRLRAEYLLRKKAHRQEVILCFGNLPPLFPQPARSVIYLQNRFLFGRHNLTGFPLGVRCRLTVERLWFKMRIKGVSEILVQTPSMAEALREETGLAARVAPLAVAPLPIEAGSIPRRFDFLYVSSGEPHKNHRRLVEAWAILAGEGLYPTLCLTLDQSKEGELLKWVDSKVKTHCLQVFNDGWRPRRDLGRLFAESGALIYPSLFESYGLPLLEAQAAGLPIVAAELDYVRDVCSPAQTFDPLSATSIARAVKRFLGIKQELLQPLSPGDFIKRYL
jgi:glycosyltransferase involved in cell wall biosynthesis